MNLLVKIKESMDSRPKTSLRIAQYVCEHPEEVAAMKIGELQEKLSVSGGSIINFVHSLGCSGYAEFRVRLAQSDGGFNKRNFAASDSEIVGRIADELQRLGSQLDSRPLDALSERIAKNKRVYLVGLDTSAYVAQIFSGYLVRLGIMSCVLGDDRTRVCSLLSEDDTVIAISYSGGTDAVNRSMRSAKEKGATTACITSFDKSELASLCDIVVNVETSESKSGEFPLISRITQLTVMEMVLSRVAEKLKKGE